MSHDQATALFSQLQKSLGLNQKEFRQHLAQCRETLAQQASKDAVLVRG